MPPAGVLCSGIQSFGRSFVAATTYSRSSQMTWTKPEFKAISLSMEVTFYVNS